MPRCMWCSPEKIKSMETICGSTHPLLSKETLKIGGKIAVKIAVF